jgi:hypothetical protein
MKKFSELMEKSGDTAVFTFGRLNPPTTGHGKLIDAMAREQGKNAGSKMHVFVSHSQDAKKNPLDYKRKVAYIRKMFPKYAKNILTDKAKTIFEVAVSLHNRYNGVQSKHGYYGFDNVEVVSAGERDPDAEGLEGMSASKMRKAAMDGDLDSFKQGVPDGFKDAEKLYKDVRKSMGIREEKNMGEMDIYEEVRDAYLTGKIWNVGDIVEANGMSGEIVRKGTNYISYMTEDNKVHKAWLHEIELDEASSPAQQAAIAISKKERGKKPKKEKVELDEKSWFLKAKSKIDQMSHPKAYEAMIKQFVGAMKNPPKQKTPASIAADIAREYSVSARALIQYINKLVDKGVIPKELKAEYQEESFSFKNFVDEMNEVKQDKDVKDMPGTQPAKYHSGVKPSVKDDRDRHFKAKKAGPAPGDKGAVTKPSVHTKKYKQMYGEVLDKDADIGDYVKDFKKSDAPQFKGKSDKKKQKMAVAAYLSRNEALLDRVDQKLTENGHTDVASMKNKVAIAYKALEKMQGELSKLGDEDELPTWWTNKVATAVSRIDDMSDYLDTQVDEAYQIDEKIAGLVKKSDKSNISYGILKKVYDRGMAAWKTGHRPGTTPQQWAFARVNSFITKGSGTWGKADKDLASQVREVLDVGDEVEESLWANIAAKRKRIKAGSGEKMRKKGEKGAPTPTQIAKAKNEVAEACWDTHKQVGMKKKGGKMVPDCVPKSEEYEAELNEWGEIEEDSEYQGRKVKLNKPMAGDIKKSKVYVKNEKGNVVKVEFGDPNMTIKKHIPARRKSFRARHNCDNPGPKWMARYWSCKAW